RGLARVGQPEFSLVYTVGHRGFDLTGMRSPDARYAYSNQSYRYTNSSIDFASAAVPFSVARKPVTLQFGWQRLYQLGTDLSADFQRVDLADTTAAAVPISMDDRLIGNIDVYSFAGSVKLTSRLALGGSFNLWRGGWTERLAITEVPPPPEPTAFLSAQNTVSVRGDNFAVGLLFTYPGWNVGLVYHAPFWTS